MASVNWNKLEMSHHLLLVFGAIICVIIGTQGVFALADDDGTFDTTTTEFGEHTEYY